MLINNSNSNNEFVPDQPKFDYSVEVLKISSQTDKKIRFNARVNGVTIYGMQYIEYVTKEGNPGSMIVPPSYKGNNEQYYNNCWFPISTELKADIMKQLEALLQQK